MAWVHLHCVGGSPEHTLTGTGNIGQPLLFLSDFAFESKSFVVYLPLLHLMLQIPLTKCRYVAHTRIPFCFLQKLQSRLAASHHGKVVAKKGQSICHILPSRPLSLSICKSIFFFTYSSVFRNGCISCWYYKWALQLICKDLDRLAKMA